MTAFMYLLFAFFFLTFNPLIWGVGGRYMMACTTFLIAFGVFGYATIDKPNKPTP